MTLRELIGQISGYRMVVVSGAQRSGTHIMAKILALELGWTYLPDTEYNTGDNGDWAKYVLEGDGIAIHCPHMSHMLHLVPDDVAVVYMYRPLDEIEESFARVNPGEVSCCKNEQMLFYSQIRGVHGLQTGKVWTKIRNDYWEILQRVVLDGRGFSFNYHDLEDHPLFYKKRTDWSMNQIEPKGE